MAGIDNTVLMYLLKELSGEDDDGICDALLIPMETNMRRRVINGEAGEVYWPSQDSWRGRKKGEKELSKTEKNERESFFKKLDTEENLSKQRFPITRYKNEYTLNSKAYDVLFSYIEDSCYTDEFLSEAGLLSNAKEKILSCFRQLQISKETLSPIEQAASIEDISKYIVRSVINQRKDKTDIKTQLSKIKSAMSSVRTTIQGVYICSSPNDWALSRNIHSFFNSKGIHTLDSADSYRKGTSLPPGIKDKILTTSHFLCVISENALNDPWICGEINYALSSKYKEEEIILVADNAFCWPDKLAKGLNRLRDRVCLSLNRNSFSAVMEDLCEKLFSDGICPTADWRWQLQNKRNVYLSNRTEVEGIATHENRFGFDFVRAVRENLPLSENEARVKSVRMLCHAATSVLSHGKKMIDDRVTSPGRLFAIFSRLLQHEDFTLEIIINAPNCFAALDVINNNKHGNNTVEHLDALFLDSYHSLCYLAENDPIFKAAHRDGRFRFYVTEKVLPYAFFQVVYSPEYSIYNHVKIDIHSDGISSFKDRPCMVIFEHDNKQNYDAFVKFYDRMRSPKESAILTDKYHNEWWKQWEDYKAQNKL